MKKSISKLTTGLTAIALLSSVSAFAQEGESKKSPWSVSGYVDAYYQYNLNSDASRTVDNRAFTGDAGTFRLGLAQGAFTFEKGDTTIVADLIVGPNAEATNFGNVGPGGETLTSTIIKQAYVAQGLSDDLTLTVGQYGTHIGYEVVEAYANANYSVSYLFANGPFYHTGAKLDYAINKKMSVMGGVINGWDSLVDDDGEVGFAAQFGFNASKNVDVFVNWAGGTESNGASNEFRNIFDLTVPMSFGATTLGLNSALGMQKNAAGKDEMWLGAALYVGYDITKKFNLALRGEYFKDEESQLRIGEDVVAATITGAFKMNDGQVIIKPEFRFDKALQDKVFAGGTDDTQMTGTIAVIGTY